MPRPPRALAPLKEAALRLFVEHGIDGTGIRELSRAAGCSEAAVYRHWANKEALVRALYQEHLDTVCAIMDDAVSGNPNNQGSSLDDQVLAAVTALYHLFDEQPLVFRFVLLAKHDFAIARELQERTPIDIVQALAQRAIDDGSATGDAGVLAAALTGTFLETATFVLYGRLPGPLSQHASRVAKLALHLLHSRT